MEKSLITYIGLVLVLCVVWNFLPKEKIPIKDVYLFIGFGLIIVYIYNNYINPIYFMTNKTKKEYFSQKTKPRTKKEHFNILPAAPSAITTGIGLTSGVGLPGVGLPGVGLTSGVGLPGVGLPGVGLTSGVSSNPGIALTPGITPVGVNPIVNPVINPVINPVTAPTPGITPIGTIAYLSPSPMPVPSILAPGATTLTIEQIKNLPQVDKDQLVQAYLLDLYKGTKVSPSSTNPYVLTEPEIVYYVGLFVSNASDPLKMLKIRDNISQIIKIDGNRGGVLLKLLNLTQINPDLSVKIAATSPLKLIDIVNAMDSSIDLTNFVTSGSSKSIQLDLIKMLQNKIGSLETAITTKTSTDKTGIPPAIAEILSSNKYVDSKGMIRDILYGDLKYTTQLTPGQMQPLGSYDSTFNNRWDNAYTILNTDKWRPPLGKTPICKQEKQCPVCPSMTSGYPLSVMDFDKSRYVMGPDGISVDYINQLNNPFKN